MGFLRQLYSLDQPVLVFADIERIIASNYVSRLIQLCNCYFHDKSQSHHMYRSTTRDFSNMTYNSSFRSAIAEQFLYAEGLLMNKQHIAVQYQLLKKLLIKHSQQRVLFIYLFFSVILIMNTNAISLLGRNSTLLTLHIRLYIEHHDKNIILFFKSCTGPTSHQACSQLQNSTGAPVTSKEAHH